MSKYNIIQETTLELRRRIHTTLTSAPDTELGLDEKDITFSPPSDNMTGSPRLSLFLYRIEPDGHLHNQAHLANGQTGLRLPPLPLRLFYLVVPLDDDEEDNHLMLGRILQHFHDQPAIDSLDGIPLDDSFGGNSTQFRIALEPLSLEQFTQLWNAFETRYRLSIAYVVRIVAIDSARGVTKARRVVDAHTAVGLVAQESSP